MTTAETASNDLETERIHGLLMTMLGDLGDRIDHVDEGVHELIRRLDTVEKFIEERRPALERGLAMLDPGAAVRRHLPGGKKART